MKNNKEECPRYLEKIAICNRLHPDKMDDLKYIYVCSLDNFINKNSSTNIFIVFNYNVSYKSTLRVINLSQDKLVAVTTNSDGNLEITLIQNAIKIKSWFKNLILEPFQEKFFIENQSIERKMLIDNKEKILNAIEKAELLKSII